MKNRSLTGKDIKKSSLGTTEVKDRSLLAKDFKAGQLPAGAQGPKGDKGAKGDKGNPGQDGPAGTARAYVVGGVGCHTAVDFCTLTRNKNVAYVAHVGQGTYCVGVNGIDASAPDSLALVSVAETAAVITSTRRPGAESTRPALQPSSRSKPVSSAASWCETPPTMARWRYPGLVTP